MDCFRNVELRGAVGKSGKFRPAKKSIYLREFLTIFPEKDACEQEGWSSSNFAGIELVARVKTVSKDSGRYDIPKQLQYSKIDRILRRK